jgi:hypothetical protein
MAGDGPGPFINFVKWFAGENPRMRFDVKRFIAEAIWWPFTAICGYHRRREGPRLWTSSVWRTARLWTLSLNAAQVLERLMERELGLPMAAVPEIVPASAQNGASGANTSQIARSRK